jgi:hypothetical protein
VNEVRSASADVLIQSGLAHARRQFVDVVACDVRCYHDELGEAFLLDQLNKRRLWQKPFDPPEASSFGTMMEPMR